MAWQALYPEMVLGLPLGKNMADAILRDGDAATTWANQGKALVPYQRVLLCERVSTRFPYVAVFPQHVQVVPTVEPGYSSVVCDTFIEVVASGQKPEDLTVEIQTRMVGLFQLLLSMDESELMAGIDYASYTTPLRGSRAEAFYGEIFTDRTEAGVYYHSAYWIYTISYEQFSDYLP
jgi:hypothetical protein